jgi:hypothetical protein
MLRNHPGKSAYLKYKAGLIDTETPPQDIELQPIVFNPNATEYEITLKAVELLLGLFRKSA